MPIIQLIFFSKNNYPNAFLPRLLLRHNLGNVRSKILIDDIIIIMAKIFLFRHAQTLDNEHRIFSGWRDTDLDSPGIEESKHVQEQLIDQKPTHAYTSDLIRCVHTLEIVLEPHNGVQVYIDPRLRERDYGSLTGRNKDDVAKEFPLEYPDWHRSYNATPPGGESVADVDKRVSEFLDDLKNSMRQKDVIYNLEDF